MKYQNYLTKDMIKQGYKQGLIRLTTDSEFFKNADPVELGVVCAIGEYWFYFGGEEAENSTVEEYKEYHSEESVVDSIYDSILALAEDWDLNGDECMYYYTYLMEHLTPEPTCFTLKFEVKRKRHSVTQGVADVYCNGENIATFGDEIVQIKDGEPYYGELISCWASKTPDGHSIRATLFHPHDSIYQISDGVKNIINAEIESEKAKAKRRVK